MSTTRDVGSYREERSAPGTQATGSSTPFATWFNEKASPASRGFGRVKGVPDTHEQSYRKTRKRVVEATSSVLGPAIDVAHEALFVGVDLLQFAPVPALDVAGKALLGIWDAVEMIEINRVASLRLTERCAELLLAIRDEIGSATVGVDDELREPVARLHSAFEEIGDCLQKQARRPFWRRYVKREEVQRNISYYNTLLDDALGLFSIRIQIRTLKLVQANEARYQPGEGTSGPQPLHGEPPTTEALPTPQDVDETQDASRIRRSLSFYRKSQNFSDRSRDMVDLRQLLHTALQTKDDVAMVEVLQVGRNEMPEAIQVLQDALQHHEANEPSSVTRRTSHESAPVHSLDQEFIRSSIQSLKRLSLIDVLNIPSGTVTGSVAGPDTGGGGAADFTPLDTDRVAGLDQSATMHLRMLHVNNGKIVDWDEDEVQSFFAQLGLPQYNSQIKVFLPIIHSILYAISDTIVYRAWDYRRRIVCHWSGRARRDRSGRWWAQIADLEGGVSCQTAA
ncbi:hypothetical protein PENSPDRAFT_655158 [Peniophora sp. CONT]|nr:hypothetical protein PENSPDRAFT_655158 [Peniophora sp. CONT]